MAIRCNDLHLADQHAALATLHGEKDVSAILPGQRRVRLRPVLVFLLFCQFFKGLAHVLERQLFRDVVAQSHFMSHGVDENVQCASNHAA